MLHLSNITNSIFTSKTYILSSEASDAVWLVDCGDFDKVEGVIGSKTIAGVLLSHAHFDHIYGLPELLEKYPGCRIYTNESGCVALGDARHNLSRYHETPIVVTPNHIYLCDEGDEIPLFEGVSARVFATPGHHPSCLCFQVGDYLFSGDAYIPDVKVVTNLPGANKLQAQESVERILELAKGKVLCAGHVVGDRSE